MTTSSTATCSPQVVDDELASLRAEFDAVICEGAGSPAEINLRATDLANMGLARAANLPVLVVGDIDRGGLLAHFFGTVAVLEPDDQRLVAGFVVNKFRGDPALLAPGLDQLERLTGRPTYGVIPYDDGLWLDAEDSLSVQAHRSSGIPQPARGARHAAGGRRPAAPHLQLHRRRGAGVRTRRGGAVGHRRRRPRRRRRRRAARQQGDGVGPRRGCANADSPTASSRMPAAGRAVLGVCGGFQMLCRTHRRPGRVGPARVEGLGLLDADIVFAPDKTLRAWDLRCAGTRFTTGRSRGSRGLAGRRHPARRRVRHPLARAARQRRRAAAVADRRGGGGGPARLRRRRRRGRLRAPRRPTRRDGRPAGRTPRRRRGHGAARRGAPPGAVDRFARSLGAAGLASR